jgi:DNA-directed RNA polymerase subunit RPC12/RpoP
MRVRCPHCRLDQDAAPGSDGKFHCQACGQKMRVAPPVNRTMLASPIPDPTPPPPVADLVPDISFRCVHCDAGVTAPASAAGHRRDCPRCGKKILVPRFAPPSPFPSRIRDLDDDEGDLPAGRREDRRDDLRDEPAPSPFADSISMGLGVTSMILGLMALPAALVPCVGLYVALPLGLVGLILGGVGLLVCLTRRGRSPGFAVAGTALSLVAIFVSLAWWLYMTEVLRTPPPTPRIPAPADAPAPPQRF